MSGFNSDDLVLKQIHICHRHGDRSSEMQVPINKEQNDLENELWKSHILDESTKDRLIKLFPSYGYGLPEKSRNSIYGKLTKNGLNRLIEFGKELVLFSIIYLKNRTSVMLKPIFFTFLFKRMK